MNLFTAIDRYVFRLVLVPMLGVFALAASLLMLEKMLRLMEFVSTEGGPVTIVFKMLVNLIPEYAGLAIPLGVMLHVHQKGVGVCGVYPYEVAETKVNQVMDFARQNEHPLQCTLEKA